MSDNVNTQRPGIWVRFPKVKNYLKRYELGPIGALQDKPWETCDIPNLTRYAQGEVFEQTWGVGPQAMTVPYKIISAEQNLAYLHTVLLWFGTHGALRGEAASEWRPQIRRAVAYKYWQERFNYRWHLHALDEFERRDRPTKLKMMFLRSGIGAAVGECLAVGFVDWAVDLARAAFDGLDRDLFNDGGDAYGRRRTVHFVLRLVADWQGLAPRQGPRCAYDEPVFNALFEQWRVPEPDTLVPLLLAACDRHTQHARYDNSKGEYFDIPVQYWYWPYEILALYRLRSLIGLANPRVDHMVLTTPLGALFDDASPYVEPLLEGVVTRARREFPDL